MDNTTGMPTPLGAENAPAPSMTPAATPQVAKGINPAIKAGGLMLILTGIGFGISRLMKSPGSNTDDDAHEEEFFEDEPETDIEEAKKEIMRELGRKGGQKSAEVRKAKKAKKDGV